ncbi:MAG: RNA polymerase sigma factor [Candidatus Kuenenbacteria bacterium]
MKKLQKGDEKSFTQIYDLYVDKIYRFVFLKTSSRETAEEIVQDVFMRFWKFAQDNENTVKSISAVLYQTARNLVIDYYRSIGRKESTVLLEDNLIPDKTADADTDIQKDIDIEYSLQEVENALKLLPEKYKDIIIMKFINELSSKEIAQALNKQEGNVRVLVHRALATLKKSIKENPQV